MRARTILSTLVVLALAAVAAAQTPVRNPTTVQFTASADHATLTRYEIGWFAGGVDPVQVGDLGKPTPDGNNLVSHALPSYPLGTTYTAKVRAYAGTVAGDWSADSNPFYRTPLPPAGQVVIK